jgi:hypothetical protein
MPERKEALERDRKFSFPTTSTALPKSIVNFTGLSMV